MNSSIQPSPESTSARTRLVMAGLQLFSEKGFDGASTREICELAGANISSIRYYFGDKAGLYRAAFTEPMCDAPCKVQVDSLAGLPLSEAFEFFFLEFLAPLKRGENVRLVMKLHFREMIEPTGAWQKEIDADIKPQHLAILGLLQRHLALEDIDLDLQRLAVGIVSMAVHYYVCHDLVNVLTPPLLADSEAIDTLAQRLAGYAVAMVKAERQRRAGRLDEAD